MSTDHLLRLGKLVGNLQSLECLLRAYLLAIAQKNGSTNIGPAYWSLQTGDVVAVDEFTSYDTLLMLIDKFNVDVSNRDPAMKIDRKVVEIRDLLAHGRVASSKQDLQDMKIIKFDRPTTHGTVRVAACAMMDDAWFDAGVKLTFDQVVKVEAAYNAFGA